jgi:signal transduction histidine kinase
VPLVSSQKTIGCLAVFSTSPQTQFAASDIELLTILASQVSVSIENALFYEQAQRRATQLEMLNRIMALISASLDVQSVLAQVCHSVMVIAHAPRSAVYLLDEEKGRCWLAYTSGLSEEFVRLNEDLSLSQENQTRCLYTHQPILVPDIKNSTLSPEHVALLKRENIRAFADFPLSTPDGQIGMLAVFYDAPQTFAADEVELVKTLALQAGVAVSNARLYAFADKTLERRADQLEILENVGRELAAAVNSPRLFEMILDHALTFTHSRWGELSLYNSLGDVLEVKASRGYINASQRFPIGEGITGRAILTRQAVYIPNTSHIVEYRDLTQGAAHSQLSIPLIHEGGVLGVLTIESDHYDAYSAGDQTFINQLATQAAVAVVNAELYSEIQRRLREQSTLYQIGSRLVANPELEGVLQTAVRSVDAAMMNVRVGIYLWDETQDSYMGQSFLPEGDHLPTRIDFRSLQLLRPAFYNTGLLRVAKSEEGAAPLLGDCTNCQAIVFPMVVKRQRLGMILVHAPRQQTFTDEELQLLHAMVAQISISLQNALLLQDMTSTRNRLSAVLNSVREGLLMLDSSGRLLLVNQPARALLGLNLDALIGTQLAALPSKMLAVLGFTPQEAEYLSRSFQQGHILTTPKSMITISDPKPEHIVERSSLPVWGQGERTIGWMIVLRDVTEETQVAQARELITETLVHDLRSPVSAVLSAVDILDNCLTDEQHTDELVEQAVRVARNSATRVLGLIESLLDIARLKAGRMDLALLPVELSSLVNTVLQDFTTQANDIGVILRHEIPAGLPPALGDPGKLSRVLTNLVDNALKFTPAGGQVVITAEVSLKDTLLVRVSDTGPGVPDEYREKIFDRFTQIPGQKGRRRGSGLGLTFCRLAVEAHGGRIWVEPRMGGGGVFCITLPAAERMPSA